MCSTCNYKNFERIFIENKDITTEKLEQSLGYGSMVIRCNTDGQNYCLAVKGEPKSEFKIYHCPTCGTFLD